GWLCPFRHELAREKVGEGAATGNQRLSYAQSRCGLLRSDAGRNCGEGRGVGGGLCTLFSRGNRALHQSGEPREQGRSPHAVMRFVDDVLSQINATYPNTNTVSNNSAELPYGM